jgi:AraC-like DNA-binding protein
LRQAEGATTTYATTTSPGSTCIDDVPEPARFEFWRETCCEPLGLIPERDDTTVPFQAHVSSVAMGPLLHVHYKNAATCRVGRHIRDISRHPRQSCSIYREASPGAWFRQAGQEFTTAPGDFVISDLDLPFETRPLAGAYAHDLWLLPKLALMPYLPATGRPILKQLNAAHAVAKLLTAYLDAVGQESARMSPDTLDRVVDNLCRLIGIAFGAAGGGPPNAPREARLAQAKEYLEQYLADASLTPARVASALGVSLRSLHGLFEPTGTSVARYIVQRRLEVCRTTLLSDRNRSVTDIAFAAGFNSLSGFYRAFQAAFGASPSDLRAS